MIQPCKLHRYTLKDWSRMQAQAILIVLTACWEKRMNECSFRLNWWCYLLLKSSFDWVRLPTPEHLTQQQNNVIVTPVWYTYCIFSLMYKHSGTFAFIGQCFPEHKSDIIDGFLKIFRLERIDVWEIIPILLRYVYTNRPLMVLSALGAP